MNSDTASPVAADHRNAFHALAAVGSAKQAGKLLASTPKKLVATYLMAKDKFGRTPLHLAAYYGHIRVLKAFMDACYEAAEVRDFEGNNARDALKRPHASVLGDPETHQNFQRLVKIDKTGSEYQDFGTGEPMDVWDIAMSSKTSVIVAEPTWKHSQIDTRRVFCFIDQKITKLDLGAHLPRFVATSNVHSLVVTTDRCFAWGKNKNGVLGLDTDEKVVLDPRMLDYCFSVDNFDSSSDANTFSALNRGHGLTTSRDPLIGVACCDFYSCCFSNTKLWCWGTNRGQMLNRAPFGAVILDPELIFEPGSRIRQVVCGDSAIFVLTTNGQVHVLSNGKVNRIIWGKVTPSVETIAGKGEFLVALTSQGKLLRAKVSPNAEETVSTLWVPRKPKDNVLSFDVGENGNVIIATKSSVYKVEDNRDILEFRNLNGMPISTIRTDSLCKSSIAVCNIDAGLNFAKNRAPVKSRFGSRNQEWQWQTTPEVSIRVKSESFAVSVHRAVLYARCPALRPLLLLKSGSNTATPTAKSVSVPGGSSVFTQADNNANQLLIANAPRESLRAFVSFLYSTSNELLAVYTEALTPPQLHEFHALCRLATQTLGTGLLQARDEGIGCDVTLSSGLAAHSAVLSAGSPVLAAQNHKWWVSDNLVVSNQRQLELVVLEYLYTQSLTTEHSPTSLIDQAQWLFDLWHLSDALLIPTLSEECENRLFGMIDFDLVIPFLQESVGSPHLLSSKLYASLLDIVRRYLAYFIPLLPELDGRTVEALEEMVTQTEGSEPPDLELAAAFELLRTKLGASPPTSGSRKKPRSTSNVLSNVSGNSANGNSTNTNTTASEAERPPTKPDSLPALRDDTNTNSGWISAKKKTRPSFSSAAEDRPVLKHPEPARPAATSPLAGLPTLNSSLNRGNAANSQTHTANASPWSPTPVANRRSVSQSGASETSHRPLISTPPTRKLTSLPRLGAVSPLPIAGPSALPKLGESTPPSKPRSKSHSKSSKPKFNPKTTLQFDSPFTMAQQLQKPEEKATPWKPVPKVVRTSPSVLEKLEREHEINNRRMTGGSVWGLRS